MTKDTEEDTTTGYQKMFFSFDQRDEDDVPDYTASDIKVRALFNRDESGHGADDTEWQIDSKRKFGRRNRWELNSTYLAWKGSIPVHYNNDTDEVLVVRFPRCVFKIGATSFKHFSADSKFQPFAWIWHYTWSAIAFLSLSGTQVEVFLECANSWHQIPVPCTSSEAPIYPSLQDIVREIHYSHMFRPNASSFDLSVSDDDNDTIRSEKPVLEYRLWIITAKDAFALAMDACLRSTNTPTSYQSTSFQLPPVDTNKMGQWIDAIMAYNQYSIPRPMVQSELKLVTTRDSPFNPCCSFSLVSTNKDLAKSYLETHGILKFPIPNKVLLIQGIDRNDAVMRKKLLPEFQVRWSDPVLHAGFSLDIWKQFNKLRVDRMRESGMIWDNGRYILLNSNPIDNDVQATYKNYQHQPKRPIFPWQQGQTTDAPPPLPPPIATKRVPLSPATPPSLGYGSVNVDGVIISSDGENATIIPGLSHPIVSYGCNTTGNQIYDKSSFLADRFFTERRISRAMSDIAMRFTGTYQKRFNSLASALCFRFMTTEFAIESKKASGPLKAAAAAYYSGEFGSMTMNLDIQHLVRPPPPSPDESGKRFNLVMVERSVFATLMCNISAGIKQYLDIPNPCIPGVMLLYNFRGGAYNTKKTLHPHIMFVGPSGSGKSTTLNAFLAICLSGTTQEITRSTDQADLSNICDIDFIRIEHEKYLGFTTEESFSSSGGVGGNKRKGSVSAREAADKAIMDHTEAMVTRYERGQTVKYRSRVCGMTVCASNQVYASTYYKNRYFWLYCEYQHDSSYVPADSIIRTNVRGANEFVKGLKWTHLVEMVVNKMVDNHVIPDMCLIATREIICLVNAALKRLEADKYPGRKIPFLTNFQVMRIKMLAGQCVIKQATAMLYGVKPDPTDPVLHSNLSGDNRTCHPHALYGRPFDPEELIPHLAPWMKDSEEIAAFSIAALRDEFHSSLETRIYFAIKQLVNAGTISISLCPSPLATNNKIIRSSRILPASATAGNNGNSNIFHDIVNDQESSPFRRSHHKKSLKRKTPDPIVISDYDDTSTCDSGNRINESRSESTPPRPRSHHRQYHRKSPTLVIADYIILETTQTKLASNVLSILKTQPSYPLEGCVESIISGMMKTTVSDYPRGNDPPVCIPTGDVAVFSSRDKSKPKSNYLIMAEESSGRRGSAKSGLKIHASVFDSRDPNEDILREAITDVINHKYAKERSVLYGQPISIHQSHVYQVIDVHDDPTKSLRIRTPEYIKHHYRYNIRTEYTSDTWEADCDLDTVSTKEILYTLGMNYNDSNLVQKYSPNATISNMLYKPVDTTNSLPSVAIPNHSYDSPSSPWSSPSPCPSPSPFISPLPSPIWLSRSPLSTTPLPNNDHRTTTRTSNIADMNQIHRFPENLLHEISSPISLDHIKIEPNHEPRTKPKPIPIPVTAPLPIVILDDITHTSTPICTPPSLATTIVTNPGLGIRDINSIIPVVTATILPCKPIRCMNKMKSMVVSHAIIIKDTVV